MSTTNITPTELTIPSCLWDNCCEIFASFPELATHIATVHLSMLTSSNCKWRACHNYNFYTKPLLIQHIYSNHLYNQLNYLPTREMVQGAYYPYYYYNQEILYPQYSTLIRQTPYTPYTYKNPQIIQNVQPLSEQTLLRRGLQMNSQSPSPSSSLVIRQNMMAEQFNVIKPSQIVRIQENVVTPSQIVEKDDPPIQCFSHSKASSSVQIPQEQVSITDLREEIDELRNLVKEQTKELNDKSQELDKNTEEMKEMLSDINEKSKEIIKLKSIITFKDSEISLIKESLELQTSVSKILQEQNCKADDKLRRMWAEMLCKKAEFNEVVNLNGDENDEKDIEDNPSPSSIPRKRVRKNEKMEHSDLHPMEIPAPPHENISVITKAIICNWEDCKKHLEQN